MIGKKQHLGLIGALVLAGGVFAPIVQMPLFGNLNFFDHGHGYGVLVLVLAVISAYAVLIKAFRLLWLTCCGSLGLSLYTLYAPLQGLPGITMRMRMAFPGDAAKPIAERMLRSLEWQWGWSILALGIVLLLACLFTQEKTVPQVSAPTKGARSKKRGQ